ncbi:SDR family NAD(P)-dependent oxidoreductase [Methylovirgula sp. 4M-Z18]|uniref:SDR family NAD(P)-dependent oxidoreductase n=1 Tax=Methylovirgula sp. 4M-Z18 TaxID=2293567 RepID=UPI000E2FE22A|nr:SDR family NAD(P)-dependent oxidoreductase [Methylovirgula sp. 4M-Z18]RFB75487.1 SDR family NAD(P)-dependent oxidoreductase [Methylovirgula sp. 4M-Z18]
MREERKRVVILGAASAIAEATARIWARDGARLVLVARDPVQLEAIALNLKNLGAGEVRTVTLDCARADAAKELGKMAEMFGGLDVVLVAYGVLRDTADLDRHPAAAEELIQTNFASAAAWCIAAGAIFERQRSGTLLVIGSVAGDRGRRSNFLYGACKGGLARLVEGLAHKLAPVGGRAVIIKPGFVESAMTASMQRKGPLWSKPDKIAAIIAKAAQRGGPVIYAPGFWRMIMLVIRHLPIFVFNRLNI